MTDSFFQFVLQRVNNLSNDTLEKMLAGRRIYIWGADYKGAAIANCLTKKGFPIEGFLDSKRTDNPMNLPTLLPENIIYNGGSNKYFIIISMLLLHKRDILDCLESNAFYKDDYYYPALEMEFCRKNRAAYSEEQLICLLRDGREIAQSLNPHEFYFLLWGGHIGDEAIALSWLWALKAEKHIPSLTVITSEKYAGLARLYNEDVDNIITLSGKELTALAFSAQNDSAQEMLYYNIVGYEWNFISIEKQTPIPLTLLMYKVRHLGLPWDTKSKYIEGYGDQNKYVQEIAQEYAIKKGKSVILIPYAKSACMLPLDLWIELASILKNEYTVYTNVAEGEYPIEGTNPIHIPLEYMVDVARYAGYTVSIRCGLADVLALGKCNCQVLYYIKNQMQERYANVNRLYVNGKESCLYQNAFYIKNNYDRKSIVNQIKQRLVSRGEELQ